MKLVDFVLLSLFRSENCEPESLISKTELCPFAVLVSSTSTFFKASLKMCGSILIVFLALSWAISGTISMALATASVRSYLTSSIILA